MSSTKPDQAGEDRPTIGTALSRRDFVRVSAEATGATLMLAYTPVAWSAPFDEEALRQSAIFTMSL